MFNCLFSHLYPIVNFFVEAAFITFTCLLDGWKSPAPGAISCPLPRCCLTDIRSIQEPGAGEVSQ